VDAELIRSNEQFPGLASRMACINHQKTGCLTNNEKKIPVDFLEFPVDVLSTYFNAIDTVEVL